MAGAGAYDADVRRVGVVVALALVLGLSTLAYVRLNPAANAGASEAVTSSVEERAPGLPAPMTPMPMTPIPMPTRAVTAPTLPAQEPAQAAAELYRVTSAELVALLDERGAVVALAELDRRITADPRLGGVCHAIAHDLGHAAFAAADGRAARALKNRDDVCGGGFTHGIVEMALGSSDHPVRDLLTICAPAQDGSCFHGVGHGVMFATGMDVGRSLALCDRTPSSLLAARCGEGVFMQLFSADVAGGHAAMTMTTDVTPVGARNTCADTRLLYAASCWFYAPTVWLSERPDDFTGAMGWCRTAPSSLGRQMCAKGVGSRTIKYHPDDPTVGARVCEKAGQLMDPCLAGMGSYWSVHRDRPGRDVCRRLGDATLAARCRRVT